MFRSYLEFFRYFKVFITFFTIPRRKHKSARGTLTGKHHLKAWLSPIDRIQHSYLIFLD